MGACAFLPRTHIQESDHPGQPAFHSRAVTAIGNGSIPRVEVGIRPSDGFIPETTKGVNRRLISARQKRMLDICFFFLYNSGVAWFKGAATRSPARGADGEARTLGDMNSNMVLGGLLIIIICQDIVAVKAFTRSVREGLLCAIVPGYILFYASRETSRQVKPLIGWLIGFGIMLMGFMR
jgi:hypothetical protein